MNESSEHISVCDEVRFAVDFEKHAYSSAHVNIAVYDTFRSDSACLFSRLCDSLFSEVIDSLVHIAVAFNESVFAIHHACARSFAKGLYVVCRVISHTDFLLDIFSLLRENFRFSASFKRGNRAPNKFTL